MRIPSRSQRAQRLTRVDIGRIAWRSALSRVGLPAISLAAVVLAVVLLEVGLRAYLSARYPSTPTKHANHDLMGDYYRPSHTFTELSHVDGETHEFATNGLSIIVRDSLESDSDFTVLLLGDSILEGAQVPANSNLSELLARRLQGGCRCINLGHAGDSPAKYLLAYRHFKSYFNPDNVLLFFYAMNDFNDDARLYHDQRIVLDEGGAVVRVEEKFDLPRRTYWTKWAGVQPYSLRHHWTETKGLLTVQVLKGVLGRIVDSQAYGPHEALTRRSGDFETRNQDLVRNNILSAFKDEYSRADLEDIARTQRFILDLQAEVERDGARLTVVLVPFAGQIEGGISPLEDVYFMERGEVANARPQEVMAEFLSERGMSFLDLLPVFREWEGALLFGKKDKHLTLDGHRLVSHEVHELMSQAYAVR